MAKDTSRAPVTEESSATRKPTLQDAQRLTVALSKAPNAEAAIEAALGWVVEGVRAEDEGGGAPAEAPKVAPTAQTGGRPIACLKIRRPGGTLEMMQIMGGDGEASVDFPAQRIGFSQWASKADQVTFQSGPDNSLVAAFMPAFPETKVVVAMPVRGPEGLWGALTSPLNAEDPLTACVARHLRVAGQALSAKLVAPRSTGSTQVLATPKRERSLEEFRRQLDLLLLCAPSTGTGVTLIVFMIPSEARWSESGGRRTARHVIRCAAESTRDSDVVALASEDTVLIALPSGHENAGTSVSDRMRARLMRCDPISARGTFASVRLPDGPQSGADAPPSAAEWITEVIAKVRKLKSGR